jgi:photosystem II stability/assembly factor-like uncharacterized protein
MPAHTLPPRPWTSAATASHPGCTSSNFVPITPGRAGRSSSPIVLGSIGLAIGAAIACSAVPALGGWIAQESGTTKALNDVTAHHGINARAWVCGEDGTILHTTNGGGTWTPQSSGTTQDLFSIAFIELTGSVIAVGAGGTILMTTDNGVTWPARESGTTADLRDVADFGFFAVGDQGVILTSTNQGTSWAPIQSPTTARLNAVSGVFVPMAVGEGGTIVRSQGAAGWVPIESNTSLTLNGLPMFSGTNLVVGEEGLVLRSSNSGASWFVQDAHTTNDLHAAEFSVNNATHIYCVGDQGTIRKTTDSGQTWIVQLSGTFADLHSVFFYLNDNLGYAVGSGGTILRTTDGGGGTAGIPDAAPGTVVELMVLPNPFRDRAQVELQLPVASRGELRLLDVTGAVRAKIAQGPWSSGKHVFDLQASALPAGVYFLTLETGIATRATRIVRLPRRRRTGHPAARHTGGPALIAT